MIRRGSGPALRVRVERTPPRRRRRAARAMHAAGFSEATIALTLRLSRDRLAALLATGPAAGLFGPEIAALMRAAADPGSSGRAGGLAAARAGR